MNTVTCAFSTARRAEEDALLLQEEKETPSRAGRRIPSFIFHAGGQSPAGMKHAGAPVAAPANARQYLARQLCEKDGPFLFAPILLYGHKALLRQVRSQVTGPSRVLRCK